MAYGQVASGPFPVLHPDRSPTIAEFDLVSSKGIQHGVCKQLSMRHMSLYVSERGNLYTQYEMHYAQ